MDTIRITNFAKYEAVKALREKFEMASPNSSSSKNLESVIRAQDLFTYRVSNLYGDGVELVYPTNDEAILRVTNSVSTENPILFPIIAQKSISQILLLGKQSAGSTNYVVNGYIDYQRPATSYDTAITVNDIRIEWR